MNVINKLRPNFLRACALIVPKCNDIRYYLNGVFVEMSATETRYVATDGHKLLIIRDQRTGEPTQTPASIIIPKETIAAMPKKFKLPVLTVDVHFDEFNHFGEARLCNTFFKPIEGKFPNYAKIVPASVSGERGNYNAEYLMDFQKAAQVAFDNRAIPEFWSNGREGVGLVLVAHYPDFVGLIMPVRVDSLPAVPPWIAPPPPAAPVEAPANAPSESVAA